MVMIEKPEKYLYRLYVTRKIKRKMEEENKDKVNKRELLFYTLMIRITTAAIKTNLLYQMIGRKKERKKCKTFNFRDKNERPWKTTI